MVQLVSGCTASLLVSRSTKKHQAIVIFCLHQKQEGSYESVYGTVAIRWEEKDGRIFVTIRIPVNTTAKLTLEESATEPEGDIAMQYSEDGLLSTEIGSGTWTVSYKK